VIVVLTIDSRVWQVQEPKGNITGSPVSDLMHLAEWRIIPVSTTTLVFERGGVLHVPLKSHAFRLNQENALISNVLRLV
jgi:hypothetical protein